nr:hypothetical protein [Tanacetum cinerariifolium]
MSTPTFAETYNLIAFLEKPIESDEFKQIVDFLNANPIKYALTVSPTIYTSCIKQFYTSVKVKIVNKDVRLQALVDGKKVIVNEASIRRDLRLDDAEGTVCLSNAAIFEELARIGNRFFSAITPLFETMMVQAHEEVGEIPTDTQDTPILTQPSSSQPQRKHKSRRKKRKETVVSQDETPTKEHIPTPSYDPLPSGEDRMQLNKLMGMCKKKKRNHGLKRLYKVGLSARFISSDEEGSDDQEDASKQGMIAEIDTNEDLSLINETTQDHGRMNDRHSEKVAENEVSTADLVTTAGEVVTTADIEEEERGELSIKEKSKLFVELMNKRKKHFEMLRAEERRRKPPNKAQKRKQMCTYLKNMAGFTHN